MNNNIGILKESSLHRHLKYRYCGSGKTEISVGDYVCDGQSDTGELIEVQIGNFGPFREKIAMLSKKGKIRIIYPIIVHRYIELYDAKGNLIRKRKSSKKGSAWDLFNDLIHAPEIALNPKSKLELVFLDIVERRKDDGKGSWRRKGVTIEDRIPIAWHESIIFKKLSDYCLFIPIKEAFFTVKDLETKARIPRALARKCIYVLNRIGVIERSGKQGNAFIYKKSGK